MVVLIVLIIMFLLLYVHLLLDLQYKTHRVYNIKVDRKSIGSNNIMKSKEWLQPSRSTSMLKYMITRQQSRSLELLSVETAKFNNYDGLPFFRH